MLFEHWIYSVAVALLLYLVYRKKYVLSIIILSAYVPDIDYIADKILKKIGIDLVIYGHHIRHGDFHNILFLIIYAVVVTLLLYPNGIKKIDLFILAGIGFATHLFEDALVFNPGYRFFWPISDKIYGIGLIKYRADFYGIANKDVLMVGLISIIIIMILNILAKKLKRENITVVTFEKGRYFFRKLSKYFAD